MDWDKATQIYELNMEFNLTIAVMSSGAFFGNPDPCPCRDYLLSRRAVLLPEILKRSEATGKDAAEIFHKFQQDVHARHEEHDNALLL